MNNGASLSVPAFAAVSASVAYAVRTISRYRASASPSSPPSASPAFHSVCVFCGSSEPARSEKGKRYVEAARVLGEELARRQWRLVYGGGSIGIMGHVARSVDGNGGKVKGVIPEALAPRELSGNAVQPESVEVTHTMHERKARMASLSSAFVALPGGFGTFEELLEMMTWTQLGIHSKSIGILNVNGFYDGLISHLEHAVQEGFVKEEYMGMLVVDSDPVRLLDRLVAHDAPRGICTWKSDQV